MEAIRIIEDGEEVGRMINPIQDMWYLEGEWKPATSEKAFDFYFRAKALNTKRIYADWSKGIDVLYNPENEPHFFGKAIVFGLFNDNVLFIRRIFR
jgi:hypothetical protein